MSSPVNNIALPPCAAILVIGFNRPALLRGLVAILAKVSPPKIYLAVDGPRPDHPGEAEKCAECVAVADTIDWPCEVKKLVREKNLGCRLGVSGAIDWFFSQEEEGIILEDDCWPDPSFLRFATELLERYRNDERVGMISGDNHYGFISDTKESYRFSAGFSIWGWATWRRVWRRWRDEGEEKLSAQIDNVIERTFLTRRGKALGWRFWRGYARSRDTWDVPFAFHLSDRELLCAVPRVNLVANVGHGGRGGTHTCGFTYDGHHFAKASAVPLPLVHPPMVIRDTKADRLHELRSFAWIPRILTVVGLKFGAFGRVVAFTAHPFELMFPSLFRL